VGTAAIAVIEAVVVVAVAGVDAVTGN
jgi:hypothetical protein